MPRTFAYVRVSKTEQQPANQINEIEAAGFVIEPHRIITETISGSMPTARRKGFARLLDKIENNDILVVTKLDRLGRNAIDVSLTVAKLEKMGIRVHCLALGGMDLTSSAGKMTMGIINAVAQFERDLLIERTQSGLAIAKSQGKILGRPKVLSKSQIKIALQQLNEGETITAIAKKFYTSRQTIMRIRATNNSSIPVVPYVPLCR
jgi:putative DNA-invertase from lambdoid prophage Rac